MGDASAAMALVVFIISYIGIIFTRLPGVNVDRPSAAFTGAVFMVVLGLLTFQEAIGAIDFNTIGLLLGMMIVITVLEKDGFFTYLARQSISVARTPTQLLWFVTFVTGISSAFLVNDAVVLLFTPVVIQMCRSVKLNPVPFLIAEIFAANIGSAMAITGNPQNMLIGIHSGISYGHFLIALAPISLVGMLLIIPIIRWFFPEPFRDSALPAVSWEKHDFHFSSMRISVPIFLLVILAFFLNEQIQMSIPVIALAGGALILLLGKIKPSQVIKGIDWVLLLFFASLFILVFGIEKAGYIQQMLDTMPISNDLSGKAGLHILSLFLSQIVSNVPFTVVMLPLMRETAGEGLWLSLASASTLAGNATIIGAMANLIVIEVAAGMGVKIHFFEFLKPGILIALTTLALSFLYLGFIQ